MGKPRSIRQPGPLRAILATIAVFASAPIAAQEIVTVAPLAPYVEVDEENRWSGPAIDLIRAAADRTDTDIVFVQTSPKDLAESGAIAAMPVFATPEPPPGMVRSLPLARDSIGLLGAGGTSGFLSQMLGLFNWGFAQVAGTFAIILLFAGALFWIAERGRNEGIDGKSGDNGPVRGIGNGFWWAGVTATTIGYGDTVPKTIAGRGIAMVWMLISMALTALLTAYLVSLTGGATVGRELAGEIDGKRVAVIGDENSSLVPANLLLPAGSVRSYPTLDKARAALDADAVDLVVHPYQALQSITDGMGIKRTRGETLMPVILVREDATALRQEIDRIILSTDWQQRVDTER